MIILTNEETIKQIKFEDAHDVANKFIDIIAPTFGLGAGTKILFKSRLKLEQEEKLRTCLSDVLKFLAVEYKK